MLLQFSPKHRAIVMTTYGAGLRISEVCALRVADIDGKRMLLHVRDAKGGRDRFVPLVCKSPSLFDWLLVRRADAPDFLFASDPTIVPVDRAGQWYLYRRAPIATPE